MNTLLTEYNLLELKDYRNLPNRKGYRKFYLNLAKMIYLIKYKIDQGQAPYFTVTVDQLAKEFDVTVKDNHDRKKKVTSILNGINKKAGENQIPIPVHQRKRGEVALHRTVFL